MVNVDEHFKTLELTSNAKWHTGNSDNSQSNYVKDGDTFAHCSSKQGRYYIFSTGSQLNPNPVFYIDNTMTKEVRKTNYSFYILSELKEIYRP